jgi:membrane-associated phospholipid phosphatase
VSDVPVLVRRRALVLAGVCVALLAAIYGVGVWTVPGQRFEDAVLRAADLGTGTAEQTRAIVILDAITVPLVVAAGILLMLICALRRRLFLGFMSVGMIAASIVTTELIQRFLQRPILLAHGVRREDQSFPSGHATVAMAVMCSLVMVVPYRLRGVVVLLSSLWAASVGIATVTASWHRPSDTIGADLIVVCYVCVAVAVLARWGRVRRAALRTAVQRRLRALLAGAYAGVAVLAFAVAGVTVGIVLSAPTDRTTSALMLVAGRSLALSGSAGVAVVLLALLRHVDLGASKAGMAEGGNPDVESRHTGVHRPPGP